MMEMSHKMKNLKRIRKAHGITQEQAASMLGMPKGTYRNWEQGLSTPQKTETLMRICELFGCSIDELYGVRQPLPVIEPAASTSARTSAQRILEGMGFELFATDEDGRYLAQSPSGRIYHIEARPNNNGADAVFEVKTTGWRPLPRQA